MILIIYVRNPWGFLIVNDFKKIENRSKPLDNEFINKWIALHVSKTFKGNERQNAINSLKNHRDFVMKYKGRQSYLTNPSIAIKSNEIINNEMIKQCGHIIGFIKISKCLGTGNIARNIDKIYYNYPFTTASHWVISNVIKLESNEYIRCPGNYGVQYITNNDINKIISQYINEFETDDSELLNDLAINDRLNSQINGNNTNCIDSDSIVPDSQDSDDEFEYPNESDNDIKIDNNDTLIDREPNKKRTYSNGNIGSQNDDDILQDLEPKRKKLKISTNDDRGITTINGIPKRTRILPSFASKKPLNTNISIDTGLGTFKKFSRANSLEKFKKAKTNFVFKGNEMVFQTVTNNNTDYLNNNIIANQRKLQQNLPDKYGFRIIVFDTELATFKPEGAIIEIAGIEIINGKITGQQFHSYITPFTKIHPKAYETHKLTKDFLNKHANGDINEIIENFLLWIYQDCTCKRCVNIRDKKDKHPLKLVAHNLPFDIRHLNAAMKRMQKDMVKPVYKDINPDSLMCFDTQQYYRKLYPAFYSLDDMCKKFSIPNDERSAGHGALIDAKLLGKCLFKLWEREQTNEQKNHLNRFFITKLGQ